MVLYKEFKVGDLFEPYLPRNKKLDKKERGRYPLICGSGVNNGVDGYTDEEIDVYENELTLSTRGSSGATFYQEGKFVLNNNSMVLKLKEEYPKNKGALIYISTHLNKLPYEGYSNYPTKTGIVKEVLELPVKTLEDTEPDWEYMEEYIKQKELMYIDKLNLEFEKKKEQLIELIGEESEYINIEELPTAKFKVGDLFNITPTNYYKGLADGDIMKEGGTTPLITTTETDNGIRGYSHLEPNNEGNTITASDTTTSEAVFYQKDPYIGRSHVQRWDAKYDINKEISLYIISCVRKSARGIYDYGNKFNRERMNNTEIELPINPEVSDIVPDWNTMEDYVNGIKHLYLHKEESNHKEKLELLFELTGWTEQDLANIENLGGNN